MNYSQACDYILDIPKFTKKNSLEQNREFLCSLGNPGMDKKIIHVAGTNGKGSVCAYLESMLLAEGKGVGFFTSPHLNRINERIRIDGKMVGDPLFLDAFHTVKAKVDECMHTGAPHPTFFEFLFGMAMVAFEKSSVEYLILETGLGGRLDATNVVEHPALTILTTIGMDHMEILGNTIEEITREKAGILKPGAPVLFVDREEKVTREIERGAKERGVSCLKIPKNAYEILEITDKHIAFSISSGYYKYTVWELQNIGTYQAENACTALEAMRYLHEKEDGISGDFRVWKKALEQTLWNGRMEEAAPHIYVDGAHNMNAIAAFVKSVRENPCFEGRKRVLLFSAVKEKEYEKMIAYLCRELGADLFVITRIENDRGVSLTKLKETFERYTKEDVVACETVEEAFAYARGEKGEDGIMFCLGSLYLAGMVRELIGGK